MSESAHPAMQMEQLDQEKQGSRGGLPPTDVRNPDYFHKVVD